MSNTYTKIKSISTGLITKKEAKENIGSPLMTISGIARSIFTITTKYGENVGFKGDFVGVNLLTGEFFESEACFPPKGLTSELERMLENSDNNEVEFNATIKTMESDKNNSGYAWIADEPETQQRANRREALRASLLQSTQGLLPSPEKAKK